MRKSHVLGRSLPGNHSKTAHVSVVVAVLGLTIGALTVSLVHQANAHDQARNARRIRTLHPTSSSTLHRDSPNSTPATTEPYTVPLRALPVALTQLPLVDVSRDVVRGGSILARVRSLPTAVWTPTGPGPFPLIIFIHGYNIGPSAYQRFCSNLTSSGYVVAAPSFPLEDPAQGFGLDRADLPNEAADVSFVITAMAQSDLANRIDSSQVAVVGHSDGADVALMLAYEQGSADPRIRAVMADAPDPITAPIQPSSVPLLLVQGTADSIVPYSASQTVFQQVKAPIFYLSLIGADHLEPISGGTPWTASLDTAAVDFLDTSVAGRGEGLNNLERDLTSLPLSRLQMTVIGG